VRQTAWLSRYDQEMAQGKVAAALITSMLGLQLGPPVFNRMPRWLLEALTNRTMNMEDKKAKPGDITMRMLAPIRAQRRGVAVRDEGTLDRFAEVPAKVLLMGGSKGLPFLKPSMDALA
jgi:hypothetical protein